MDQSTFFWVISGISSIAVVILSVIWNTISKLGDTVSKLDDKVDTALISHAATATKLDNIKQMQDKLPCVSNVSYCNFSRRS